MRLSDGCGFCRRLSVVARSDVDVGATSSARFRSELGLLPVTGCDGKVVVIGGCGCRAPCGTLRFMNDGPVDDTVIPASARGYVFPGGIAC